MRTTGYPQTDHAARVRGFAAILHEDEYLDLIARHKALHQGDYSTYLADLHSRMIAAKQAQKQVLIGPFLADQYESYAEAIGEPATSKHALRAYDDFVARVGPYTRTWTGEPITQVISDLREVTDTTADQARLLPLLKQAADQHPDPQRAAADALSAAAELFAPLLKRTEPGHHTLTCTVQLLRQTVRYALPVVRAGDIVAFPDGRPEQLLCAALATAHLADHPATLLLRSHPLTSHAKASHPTPVHPSTHSTTAIHAPTPPAASSHPLTKPAASVHAPPQPAALSRTPDQPATSCSHPARPVRATIRAWRLTAGRAIPLTAAQAFALARTDPTASHPAPPDHGAQYVDAFPLASEPP